MNVTRISAVSYLNSTPFVYGIKKKLDPSLYELQLDIPSVCAQKLLDDKVDLGLIPVAVIPQLNEHHIVSDFCIGATGKVRSVMLYSEKRLDEIENILLDNQSRTSVLLVQVLAKYSWKIKPHFFNANEGFEKNICGSTAGVVIGDRTFAMNGKFPFVYDLAEEWFKFTGLPFVFACWVANKKLPSGLILKFNEALSFGIQHINDVIAEINPLPSPKNVISDYLHHHISFTLDDEKKKGMNEFLRLVKGL